MYKNYGTRATNQQEIEILFFCAKKNNLLKHSVPISVNPPEHVHEGTPFAFYVAQQDKHDVAYV